ncbi:hypothetical protein CULCOIPH002_04970 [Corynebacterium ulcerans]|nr:hypothetical protein CULCOIPH001_01050 [Corynebacterium ulcerans]GJJ35585.1 hypothetical protein CULCOIPH002_04970 [Corynebacterium ulcerans]
MPPLFLNRINDRQRIFTVTVELLVTSAFYFEYNDALVHVSNLSGIFGGFFGPTHARDAFQKAPRTIKRDNCHPVA